ncbi:MAG: MFS transporter [Crocinitomicaceae bacterium]|nr:MFS transporter [Crocinitomicaceae bacterium]
MKATKRVQNAWAMYDWANSTYSLVIGTAIFPLFYAGVTKNMVQGGAFDDVIFFGRIFKNTEVLSYCLALGMALVCILSPTLSGIADYMERKKTFMKFFCYLGALACGSLVFFDIHHFELSMVSVVIACLGFWCSYAFSNSFLPEIAEPEEQDKLSAKAYSLGYIGSVILLVINLVMIQVYGVEPYWSFVTVAVWWIGFAQYTFYHLKEKKKDVAFTTSVIGKGFRELRRVWEELRETKRLKRYLLTFFVMSMGVQTIMQMASLFGTKEVTQIDEMGNTVIGLNATQLIVAVLLVQLIAVPGAMTFSFASRKLGNLIILKIALLVWIAVCLFAYFGVHSPVEFYITAGAIGFIMGGTQSLARSTYSKFLPETEDTASYFSFFDATEKVGLIIGLLSFGYIEGFAGSMRASVLALISFFVIGFILILFVPQKENSGGEKVFRV